MFDLGRSILASAERSPDAIAIIDGDLRLTYAQWLERIRRLVGAFDRLALRPGDRIATALQNTWQMATIHWACQLAGIAVVPLNWRVKADELDYCLPNAEVRALFYQDVSADAVRESAAAQALPRIVVGDPADAGDHSDQCFADLLDSEPAPALPRATAEHVSLFLYTSGTTGKPKGVPRRHRTERAAAIAHVAQNCYRRGERTLGVMPLYHTMGVRSLLAMALVDGCFVCLPRFDTGRALDLIASERLSCLYLVPTLYHDLLADPKFASTDVSSVRKLGFAGASMTDGLLKRLDAAFRPELFVNHYGSSEIYTFTIDQNAPAKPGSAGKAALNQRIRIVRLGSFDPDDCAASGEEGQIVADLFGDESFEGYWKRPDADAKALHAGWYFTGDIGFLDADGDLFVTGRVDDMIITGGENVSPVEIESVLSLHDGVLEVAVAGLPDERWGQRVVAFVKRARGVEATDLDDHCRTSGLANFKRPREYVFLDEIPKSPVGKILRRKLQAGEFALEQSPVE
ncbi:AMP-binding protein (plasmid) [Azospirillum oryzae]|uniref:AMP-binding protein n=1 Tax=Azospirillum oryzae TaxID=286727 RepID=A0A6N1AGS7_9PROT|nr:AMP-binding protein [Azospirillum oryzae]KAA0587473.1 AMP-binding protein [Azospirillum oryzae]QKS50469.1 AMP-binding protein [Azospirillum oryzae]GLR78724.1 4-chlorobenzoate--CoA ligase [Azospirillum oryzae]